MVQEHDRAPGIGGDGLHATDDLGHGAAGVFFLDVEPALVVVHTPFLGLGAGHARQVGLPADVIDQYRAAPAGLLLVACAHARVRALRACAKEQS